MPPTLMPTPAALQLTPSRIVLFGRSPSACNDCSRNSRPHRLCLRKLSRVLCRHHASRHRTHKRRVVAFASLNDGNSASGSASYYAEAQLEETRSKLNASFQLSESGVDYTQALHEAARKFQLGTEQHESSRKTGWLSKSWLGVDQTYWIKPISYQAAIHSLLQAVLEVASRGHGGDRDTHIFIQRSISRQLTPLQESIDQQFSARNSDAEKHFWSHQHPMAVASFVDLLESDSRFTAVTSVGPDGASVCPSTASDVSLMTLAISCAAAVIKLGSAKISCPSFFSTLSDEINRLLDMLVNFLPIDQVYSFTSGVGLRSQFLGFFGARAVTNQKSDERQEERAFWVDLSQQLLWRAIVREHIRSKLTSYDSVEVLERDLAIFGFFAALGRRTQDFFIVNNCINSDETVSGLLRYLIGGSVLFYPQLSSLNTYQLFIEVVSEELEWLPFYPTSTSNNSLHGHNERSLLSNMEAIELGLDQCTRWIDDFLKYCTWVQQPAGVRSLSFLLKSQARLSECNQLYRTLIRQNRSYETLVDVTVQALPLEDMDINMQGIHTMGGMRNKGLRASESYRRNRDSSEDASKMEQLRPFDKELRDVDEALSRLECLLLEQEGKGKEQLTAACTNLETIRQLKLEIEMLETSLQRKERSMLQSESELAQQRRQRNRRKRVDSEPDRKFGGIRSSEEANQQGCVSKEDEGGNPTARFAAQGTSTTKETQNFERLRQELLDLETRIKESIREHRNEQDLTHTIGEEDHDDPSGSGDDTIVETSINEDIITQSLQKIKETSTDVWRGTQLLAMDVAAAMVLLKRSASGEELTERENKILKRTITDLASVIPIGILMLLPVTAVGHAAILAAIQRYAPALIPSAYARERLDLIKQLEQIRELDSQDVWDEKDLTQPSLLSNIQNNRVSND